MKSGAGPTEAFDTVFVDEFTDGLLYPDMPMLGPVRSGGHIVANTSPGCWGPMITPAIRGGHEVNQPVAVEGAAVGDAILIRIKDITVTSLAAASGVDTPIEGRHTGNAALLAQCPECGTRWPETRIEGTGEEAVRCVNCGAEASPFRIVHGYTMAFDAKRELGVTLPSSATTKVAEDARRYTALPDKSHLNPFLVMAPSHLPGVVARLRPFMGNIGTTPAVRMPGSSNAGDSLRRLVNAPHEFGLDETAYEHRTDGHLDCDAVRAGTILVCPVKVPGGGIYVGDMHAMQGDGEIAGHTVDVSGTVTLQVEVMKGLNLDGPILFPLLEDLPYLAKPLTDEERRRAKALAEAWGVGDLELSAPISFIGTGATINAATDNGIERAARCLGMTTEEVRNRATITGSIEIARAAGVAQVTFLAPLAKLDAVGLGNIARQHYGILE